MSNELINVEGMSDAQLAALTGQDGAMLMQPRDDGGFPRLRVNADHEDDEGKPLKAGTFAIYFGDRNWYADTVVFRPFINGFQYLQWDPRGGKDKKGAYVNKSIVIRSFKEEAIDELGTVACGKIKNLEGLSADVAERQKQIKCFRLVMGRISGEFRDGPSKEAETRVFEDHPVLLRLRGSNFMPIGDVFQEMSKSKKLIFQHNLHLSLKREKAGQTVYYVIQPKLDDTKVLPFGESEMKTFQEFDGLIKDVNKGIWKAHEAALKKFAPEVDPNLAAEFAKDFELDGLNDSVDDLGR